MNENKPNKKFEGVKIEAEIYKQIQQEALDDDIFAYEVVARAWRAYKGGTPATIAIPSEANSRVSNSIQLDILEAMKPLRRREIEALVTLARAAARGGPPDAERKDSGDRTDAFVRAAAAIVEAARGGSEPAKRALKLAGLELTGDDGDQGITRGNRPRKGA